MPQRKFWTIDRRLHQSENRGLFVYLRHMQNAWQFDTGTFLDPRGWSETIPPPQFTAERLAAYANAVSNMTGSMLRQSA
jgi:hypothetical protein